MATSKLQTLFPGYYKPTQAEQTALWGSAAIVLDTNTLLNLYRFSEDTRKDWETLLLSLKGKLWIPYQVAAEFQKNRLSVIATEEKKYELVAEFIKSQAEDFTKSLDKTWRFAPPEVTRWKLDVEALFEKIVKQTTDLQIKHPNLLKDDVIRTKIRANRWRRDR